MWDTRGQDLGEINDGLEQALRTRPLPGSVTARLGFLLRAEKGSTKRLAGVLGVSQRTVQRWVTPGPGWRQQWCTWACTTPDQFFTLDEASR
jgi:hypothetical protein